MNTPEFGKMETAWCPGCGNFGILDSLKLALEALGKDPHEVVMVGGIGQAAKTPQYLSANSFCGLHGRALPPAVAIKMANPNLTVIVNTGDGDSYGEGGNHFLHNIRRNVDMTHFVHDNQVYGLTKGQSSPTTLEGMVTGAQAEGSQNIPFNPVLLALAAGAGFVARGFSGKPDHLQMLMERAIRFKGYALVDIFQPCVSFNRLNTFAWYNSRVYELDESHDATDRLMAMSRAMEFGDRIPIGVLYEKALPDFHEKNSSLSQGQVLAGRRNDPALVRRYMSEMV
ncbi:MAG: thiamine pyrophosphate-dependent enzyme [Eubacteriales bacterium]|jgi:2-oxoglutarate ferredoxin oxidoreductase subunit beta|nr:thiamine pyrophosphate-dependent enzyme [Eubacteriales bacterium]MDD3109791.1 thiamine pyrophosphate-dependent enzyme [Eubacteriales bacterium]MDD3572403.1 thiamine pyrophosphate-dependent enzyme [Eubacteriales bacterium]MDD4135186.1 thiamine pyrophosphate-dependent enzyme [Eubacteriales bacterium]NLO13875.1 2-oxoacid ferredoxin oxidoreductase [Clostridiales bacterium]